MKLPYSQVIIQLDRLFFEPIHNAEHATQQSDTIDAYLKSVGYTWDDILQHLIIEDKN